jgi:hypothetical protein
MALRLTLHVHNAGIIHRYEVSKTTTLNEIIDKLELNRDNIVVFSSVPEDPNSSPLINLTKNFVELNMWYESPIEITIHNKSDISKYNVERYNMYSQMQN